MTHVNSKCCETCAHGVGEWDHEAAMPVWYCYKDQFGSEQCGCYERDPGSEG